MIDQMKKGEWNVAKGPNPKTTALKKIRLGRPTLIHDSSRLGTFIGNLKETYKFGPAFQNTDRKVRMSNKATAAKASNFIEQKEIAKIKRVGFWNRIRAFFAKLMKGGKR